MEEDIDILKERLFDQLKNSVYPSERAAIRNRYTDTSYLIFKTSQTGHRGSFLSFGSRRASLVSSYGNTPTFIRRSFSSNGMLEYSVEQSGTTKSKDISSHTLPSITKEEKEMEDAEERNMLDEAKTDVKDEKRENINKNKVVDKDEKLHKDEETNLSSIHSEFGSKNRKIFLHYDMPLSRKPPVQNNLDAFISETSEDSVIKMIDGECSGEGNKNLENGVNNRELKGFASQVTHTLLPKIPEKSVSQKTSTELEENLSQNVANISRKNSLLIVEEDQPPLSSNSLERSSINDKNESSFPRASTSRLSLRELPRRSPTPPKRSPRKTSKKEKYITKTYLESSPDSSNSSFSCAVGFGNTLPPLVTSQLEIVEPCDQHCNLPPISSAELNGKCIPNLDNTPLYIVEEGDQITKMPPSSSPSRVQLENLVSDRKLNSSFIVVHSPKIDANSLGLAPLPLKNKKSSSSTSSSTISTTSHMSRKKNFYSQTVERSSSTTKTKKSNNSSSSSSTFFSSKESSQIQLLKFFKSQDESNSMLSSLNDAKASSYLVGRSRIRSLPLDYSLESRLTRFSNTDLTDTNLSRVCSIM